MRLKYHSLIALGISSIILNGCATGGGGFLNLGVVDALKKSKACVFKQKLTYTTTPIGNSGLSLPTFGSSPTHSSGPVIVNSHTAPQQVTSFPPMSQPAPIAQAAPTSSCGCSAGSSIVDSSQYNSQHDAQFYMPARTDQTSEIVEPPINAVPNRLIESPNLPSVNPLPTETLDSDNSEGFDTFDTEGELEPLGQIEKMNPINSAPKVIAEKSYYSRDAETEAVESNVNDQSIFEAAKVKESKTMIFDEATDPTHAGHSIVEQKPAILTLHARPAQSHHVFDRAAQQQKSIATMQASHKRNFRQQNTLRPKIAELNSRDYRQAMKPEPTVEFKPLPPVIENTTAPAIAPETKLAPLPTQKEDSQKDQDIRTRTAETSPRVPILRATTASSASIRSLTNIANVLQGNKSPQQQYEADRRTAQGSATSSVQVLKDGEATIER